MTTVLTRKSASALFQICCFRRSSHFKFVMFAKQARAPFFEAELFRVFTGKPHSHKHEQRK